MTAGWFLFVAGAIFIASGFKNVRVTDLITGNTTTGNPSFGPDSAASLRAALTGGQAAGVAAGQLAANDPNNTPPGQVNIPGITPLVGHPANVPTGKPHGAPPGFPAIPGIPRAPKLRNRTAATLLNEAVNFGHPLQHGPRGASTNPIYKHRIPAHPGRTRGRKK